LKKKTLTNNSPDEPAAVHNKLSNPDFYVKSAGLPVIMPGLPVGVEAWDGFPEAESSTRYLVTGVIGSTFQNLDTQTRTFTLMDGTVLEIW